MVVLPVPLTPTTSTTAGRSPTRLLATERSRLGSTRRSRSSRSQPRTVASSVVPSTLTRARRVSTSSVVASTPRSEPMRVSSTSSQAASSRRPRESRASRPCPRAVLERDSRARRRVSRPWAESGRSRLGTGSGSGRVSGAGRVSTPPPTSSTERFGASRGSVASSPTPGSTSVSVRGSAPRGLLGPASPATHEPEQHASEDHEDPDGDGNPFPQLINHAGHPPPSPGRSTTRLRHLALPSRPATRRHAGGWPGTSRTTHLERCYLWCCPTAERRCSRCPDRGSRRRGCRPGRTPGP